MPKKGEKEQEKKKEKENEKEKEEEYTEAEEEKIERKTQVGIEGVAGAADRLTDFPSLLMGHKNESFRQTKRNGKN